MRVLRRNPDRTDELAGPLDVDEILARLDIAPHTVLVIRNAELVPPGATVSDQDEIEIRPVISGGAGPLRCVICRGPAVIEVPRHRSAWCADHFRDHVGGQVRKAIDSARSQDWDTARPGQRMFSFGERLLVAVSGGKDSLALWHVLLEMGYQADGLYVGLGIGGYSDRSGRACQEFADAHAAPRGRRLITVDLADEYGYRIPEASRVVDRPTCAICGLSKRYLFNRVAVEHGYDVAITGHNLDDEAATLLGNVVRWQEGFLARQRPLLPGSADGSQVRKAKPLYRLSEREMAAYCVVAGIDYVVEECPLVAGNSGHELKESLDVMEATAPGLKAQFLFGFLERQSEHWPSTGDHQADDVGTCAACGMPTTAEVCAFCRQRERIAAALPVMA